MKRTHRRAHVIAWSILLPLTLLALVLAFAARKSTPIAPASDRFGSVAPASDGLHLAQASPWMTVKTGL